MPYRLLHVTDLHLTQSSHWTASPAELDSPLTDEEAERIARLHFEELKRALWAHSETQPPFDAVVLGGDFTHRHHGHGFAIAAAWLELLVREDFTDSGRVLAVPGNHDVNLGETYYVFSPPRDTKTKRPAVAVLSIPQWEAEREYRAFLKRASRHLAPANEHLSSVVRIPKPRRVSEHELIRGLVLVGLNSCRIERHNAQGWGYIGLDQLDTVLKALQSGGPDEGDALVALTHHNPLPLWDVALPDFAIDIGDRKISFLTDAASVLELLTSSGFSVLLHGHSHRPKLAALEGYDFQAMNFRTKLVISGQGSFCAYPSGWESHNLAVIHLEPRGVYVHAISAPESAMPTSRRWTPGERDYQPLSEVWNWSTTGVKDTLEHFADSSKVAAVQWEIMSSWAPLYVRQSPGKASSEWQIELKRLAEAVSDAAGYEVTRDIVETVIDAMLGDSVSSREMSSMYLPQYLLLRLESDGLGS